MLNTIPRFYVWLTRVLGQAGSLLMSFSCAVVALLPVTSRPASSAVSSPQKKKKGRRGTRHIDDDISRVDIGTRWAAVGKSEGTQVLIAPTASPLLTHIAYRSASNARSTCMAFWLLRTSRATRPASLSQILLPLLQARTRDLARPLPHRRRHCRLVRRRPARTHLPHRHEPRRARSPALATHRLHWVDCRLRSGGLCIAPLPYRRPRVARWYQKSSASVSGPSNPFLDHDGRARG